MFVLPAHVPIHRVKQWNCFVCGVRPDAESARADNITVSRIDGDSANGYELYHSDCLSSLI